MVEFQVEFLKTLEDGVRLVPDLEKLEKVEQFKVSLTLKPLKAAPLCLCWAILWVRMNPHVTPQVSFVLWEAVELIVLRAWQDFPVGVGRLPQGSSGERPLYFYLSCLMLLTPLNVSVGSCMDPEVALVSNKLNTLSSNKFN